MGRKREKKGRERRGGRRQVEGGGELGRSQEQERGTKRDRKEEEAV